MFLKDKPGLSAWDKVLMNYVNGMHEDDSRENKRGKTQYPPSSSGLKNGFGSAVKTSNGKGYKDSGMFLKPGRMFNPNAKLDTTQVEDRRSPQALLLQFLQARGAMAGSGIPGRPTPPMNPDFPPGIGTTEGAPRVDDNQSVLLSILKQYAQGRR